MRAVPLGVARLRTKDCLFRRRCRLNNGNRGDWRSRCHAAASLRQGRRVFPGQTLLRQTVRAEYLFFIRLLESLAAVGAFHLLGHVASSLAIAQYTEPLISGHCWQQRLVLSIGSRRMGRQCRLNADGAAPGCLHCGNQRRAAHRVDCEVGTCALRARVVHSLRDWAAPVGGPRRAALWASDHISLEYPDRLYWEAWVCCYACGS